MLMTRGGKAGEGSLCVLGSSGDEGEPPVSSLIPEPAIKELPGQPGRALGRV